MLWSQAQADCFAAVGNATATRPRNHGLQPPSLKVWVVSARATGKALPDAAAHDNCESNRRIEDPRG